MNIVWREGGEMFPRHLKIKFCFQVSQHLFRPLQIEKMLVIKDKTT